jgi:hypothetical protein
MGADDSSDPASTVNMILKKAKTSLGKRTLMKKAPKLVENDGKAGPGSRHPSPTPSSTGLPTLASCLWIAASNIC